jgi:hypothetical protein
MKIYIEVVLIFVLIGMFLGWKLWFMYSQKSLLKKYKREEEKNGKSREGRNFAEQIVRVGTTEPRNESTISDNVGYEQSERRELLQEKPIDDIGKDSVGTGNDSNNTKRRFFFRRKK